MATNRTVHIGRERREATLLRCVGAEGFAVGPSYAQLSSLYPSRHSRDILDQALPSVFLSGGSKVIHRENWSVDTTRLPRSCSPNKGRKGHLKNSGRKGHLNNKGTKGHLNNKGRKGIIFKVWPISASHCSCVLYIHVL